MKTNNTKMISAARCARLFGDARTQPLLKTAASCLRKAKLIRLPKNKLDPRNHTTPREAEALIRVTSCDFVMVLPRRSGILGTVGRREYAHRISRRLKSSEAPKLTSTHVSFDFLNYSFHLKAARHEHDSLSVHSRQEFPPRGVDESHIR